MGRRRALSNNDEASCAVSSNKLAVGRSRMRGQAVDGQRRRQVRLAGQWLWQGILEQTCGKGERRPSSPPRRQRWCEWSDGPALAAQLQIPLAAGWARPSAGIVGGHAAVLAPEQSTRWVGQSEPAFNVAPACVRNGQTGVGSSTTCDAPGVQTASRDAIMVDARGPQAAPWPALAPSGASAPGPLVVLA